jgi:hypothetical protein
MTKTKVIELLTPEKVRVYHYPEGKKAFIEGATYLNYLDDGSHLVRHPDVKDKVLIPAGWSSIEVFMKQTENVI